MESISKDLLINFNFLHNSYNKWFRRVSNLIIYFFLMQI